MAPRYDPPRPRLGGIMLTKLSIVPFLGLACSYSSVDIPYDEDGDGLMSDDEAAYGTDPQKPDSDGDSYDDGEEVAGNTDPTNRGDHPYEGGWPIDACRNDVESTGMGVGEIAPDFELEDQFGETVRLHDFCGKAILLTFGAAWCEPCRANASMLESIYQRYDPTEFIAIDVLYQDEDSRPATVETAANWAEVFGLTVPVLVDPDQTVIFDYVLANAIPSETLMKPGVEIFLLDTLGAAKQIDTAL
jgi:peroxiredoxin